MMLKIRKLYDNNKKLFNILFVLVIGFIFSAWLLKPGILNGHDMTFHLSRIKGIRDSILAGDFRALIHKGLYGYGYANGIFYGNLLLYVPAIFSALGINLINSYKIYVAFCTFLSAITMYICMKTITKSDKIGLIGSFLYSACSYKMCDFIIRAAAGEIGAFVFLPLIALGIYEIIYGDYKKWWIFSIGFVGLIQCHLISTVMMAAVSAVIIIINYEKFFKEKERFISLITSAVVGLLTGAYFIFPLLEGLAKNELIVNLNSFPIWNYTVPFEKLFLGFPYYGWDDSPFLPAGIGIVFVFISLYRFKIKKKKGDKLLDFCDVLLIVSYATLICATDFFPWKELTFLQSIQFPWRLYLISSLFLAVSSSIILYYYLKEKSAKERIKFILPIIVLAMFPYIITENYYRAHSNGGIFYNWDDYTVASGEYLPQGTEVKKLQERGDIVTSNNNIKVRHTRKDNKIIVNYSENNFDNTYVEVPLIYYYGYTAVDENNQEYKISKGHNNVIRVKIPNKEGKITVYYKGTKIQKYSVILSIISIIGLLIYIFRSKRCKNEKRKD